MTKLKLIKGVSCALLMLSSKFAVAGWQDIQTNVNTTQSRAVLDRINRVYFTYVTLENTGTEAIDGPFRVLVNDATLPVVNAHGTSDDGVPYIELELSQLMPGDSHQVRVDFELLRTRLSFSASVQNDVQGWELVWSDEFEGSEIDSSKWSHEVNCDGGGNNEKQCYTASEENSFVEDGILNIVAKPENGQPLPYSSARLRTIDKGDWTYGRFEIRAKAPTGQGAWPAIWMLPTDQVYGGWPHSGEIDIFEAVNLGVPLNDGAESVKSEVHGTLHYGESWPNNDSSGMSYLLPDGSNPADDFHTYAIEWEEGEMRWYVDDVLYQTQLKSEVTYNTDGQADGLAHRGWHTEVDGEVRYDNSPFDERFHMILNFAVGGDWPESVDQRGIDASAFDGNNKFEIDYVRVYECSVLPSKGQGCATVSDGYLDSVAEGGTLNEGAAPIPIPPSTGIAEDLIVFENTVNPAWPAWDCCGGSIPTIEFDDADHAEVVEFVVGANPTVLGFNTNVADVPSPYDGSPMLDNGVLEFDLKLVTPPNNASAAWNLKVEQGGVSSEASITIDTPTSEWQHYAISLKELNNAGLNLNGIDVIMIFPDWGQGEGAVFRVDNLTILEGEVNIPSETTELNLDFENSSGSYNFNNFDGGFSTVIANPDTSGLNSSAQIVQMQKFAGQPWGGTAIPLEVPLTVAENSVFSMKVWSNREVAVLFKIEGMNVERSVNHTGSGWEKLYFDFAGVSGNGVPAVTVIFDLGIMGNANSDPDNWTFYYDDIQLETADTGPVDTPEPGDELLSNGSFDDGTSSWIGAVNVVFDADNNVFKTNVTTAGNPWDVNLSQVMPLMPGQTYVLSFRAKASLPRSMLAGLGLNHDPWSALTEASALTTDWQTYTYTFTPDFGDSNSRVLFDMGAEVGEVYIDDVSVVIQSADDGSDGGDNGQDGGDNGGNGDVSELVNDGSFDNAGGGWIGNLNVVQEDGNNIFMANVAVAGNVWDVNLSQPMTLVTDETYMLSFKAKASVARTIVAGLGLNYAPWTNSTEIVPLDTDWQTFSYIITSTGFGGENNRVFFDLGGEAGIVYIDDVSVVLQESNGAGGPVAEDEFVLIASSGASDIAFESNTVGEWSTGSQIQDNVMFDGLLGWEITSSANSPEQGNWGTALAFQNGIQGDLSLFNRISLKIATSGTYSGGYKIAISGNGVSKEISLPVNEAIRTWQTVSLDTADIPINMSDIDWIAVYGIGGQPGVSAINLTDFSIVKDENIAFDSTTEDDFVFISSDPNVETDLIVDGDNFSSIGNVIFGEWSTGTIISDITYDGLDGIGLNANGSWGAVLALQGDISDGSNIDNYDVDFSQYTNIKMKVAAQGAFERYALSIVSNIDGNEVTQEVDFSLANQSDWNQIDIDLGMYGIDLSNVSQIALFGVYQSGSAGQSIYITDLIAYDTGKITPAKDSSDDKFVFFSSTGEETDMVFDGDDFAHNGNITMSEWSTGTTFTSGVTYSGLNAFELTRASSSWGAVLSLMGDIHGDVQEYDIDVAQYSTLNFKMASQGTFSEYTLDFLVDGAEFKVPLSVNNNWTDMSIELADIPLNFSKLTQIAIFAVGGNAGNKVYLTDYNLTK